MKVRLAVFDMVGTTIRAGDEVPSSFRDALLSAGVELSDSAITLVRGRSKREAIADLLSADPATSEGGPDLVESVYARFQALLRLAYRTHAQAVPGAEAVFEFLRRAGIEVVLATGLDRETASLLVQSVGWSDIGLLGVITGDDVEKGRPAPDLIHAAMRLAGGMQPDTVLVVGDTASDLEAAAAAQVGWSIGVLSGAHSRSRLEAEPHSAILESVAGIPDWLLKSGAVPSVPHGARERSEP